MTHSPIRAAEYVRMSSEHQNYSIERQRRRIADFAIERSYQVVRTYADEGISGVSLERRNGLRALLADVVGGAADFDVVLIYDVSRWGRFQDPDEAAHYEFLCRSAGIRIEYCAEQFENDGSLSGVLLKQLKRAMAAEYSRDLSARIIEAKRMLAQKGFWQCGAPPFGLRRMLVRSNGDRVAPMQAGERKLSDGHRTVLVAGPPAEVAIIRDIFRLFVVGGLSPRMIAQDLNGRADGAKPWTPMRVKYVLKNEAYVGAYVYGRTSESFRVRRRRAARDWIRVPNHLEPMVKPAMFREAQRLVRRNRPPCAPDDVLIAELQAALALHGRLSAGIIRADPNTHCPAVYAARFGSLSAAYTRAGYTPNTQQAAAAKTAPHAFRSRRFRCEAKPTREELIADLQRLYLRTGHMSIETINSAADMRHAEVYRAELGGMAAIYEAVGHTPSRQQRLAVERTSRQRLAAIRKSNPEYGAT